MGNHRSEDADIPDQTMKVWLEERIVRLALYRYELDAIGEQIEALDQHADFLQSRGHVIPESEQQQRETLEGAYLGKLEEVQQAFEPSASHPFSLEEEMNISCQMLARVNERIKRAAPTPLSAQETAQANQEEMNAKAEALRTFIDEWTLIEQRCDRFQAIEVTRTLSEKEQVEYQHAQAQEQALWNVIEVAFPEYRARGQPYVDINEMQEDLRRYRRAAALIGSYLEGTIRLHHLQARLEEVGVEYPALCGQAESALSHLQQLRDDRRASEQPSHQHPHVPHKIPLRDLYNTDEQEPPEHHHDEEPDHSH